MRKISKAIVMFILLALLVSGCGRAVRKEKVQRNEVRIYDVIPQDREKVENYEVLQDQQVAAMKATGEQKEKELERLRQLEELTFKKHELRIGMFTGVMRDEDSRRSPYAGQIEKIQEVSGVEIEYVVLDSWEALRQELAASQGDGVTKLVIFDHSYDQSLMKEMMAGKYANLEGAMQEAGFYDEAAYEQAVLQAGRIEGQQVLVPILYNVAGMIRGESLQSDSRQGSAEPEEIQGEALSFADFLTKLEERMKRPAQGRALPFLSGGFLEEQAPDLFLCAAGADWEDYRNQEALFKELYDYSKIYQGTQVAAREDGIALQSLWAEALNQMRYEGGENRGELPQNMVDILKLQDVMIEDGPAFDFHLAKGLLEKTDYLIESTGADDIPYHSVMGLLAHQAYYQSGSYSAIDDTKLMSGKMGYWPIGMMQEAGSYAAQPISYVAVWNDGDEELAVRVIKAMTQQLTLPEFGFSIDNAMREEQLQTWSQRVDYYGVRYYEMPMNAKEYREGTTLGYWSIYLSGQNVVSGKEALTAQVREQLEHVARAQIADREILQIWQDTVAEAVASDLGAEAGFALLCERMDAWWQ